MVQSNYHAKRGSAAGQLSHSFSATQERSRRGIGWPEFLPVAASSQGGGFQPAALSFTHIKNNSEAGLSTRLWSPLPGLRTVPNRQNRDPLRPYSVENQIRSASQYQFPHSRLTSRAAQIRMLLQSLSQSNDARRQSFRGVRLVPGHVSPYLLQLHSRPRRPDNL